MLSKLSDEQLSLLYRTCRFTTYPSTYEGWGLPVTEALANGVPVACADASCLPEQTQGAALLFDPFDVGGMAQAMRRLWQDETLRGELREKGLARARALTWSGAARSFRALYRSLAGQTLGEVDRGLILECFRS